MATRDWRHEDRQGSRDRDDDRRYGVGRFEHDQYSQQPRDERGRVVSDDEPDERDDDNRGWLDRVRDTASRWWHGHDEDDERDDERYRYREDDGRRGFNARYQPRDDRSRFSSEDESRREMRPGTGHERDRELPYRHERDRELRQRYGNERDRELREGRPVGQRDYDRREHRERERFSRSWQDDDNRGRMRNDEDNRVRQFASHGRDDDDRSGQFNRLHEERGTLGRRGDLGASARSRFDRYDERGRFSGSAGDEARRYDGEGNRNRPLGDERNTYERHRMSGEDRDLDRSRDPDEERYRGQHERQFGRDERRGERQFGRSERGYREREFGREREVDREAGTYGGPRGDFDRDRGDRFASRDDGRSMRGENLDRDEYGRFAPGRQEHVEHDDRLRRGTSRLSDRSRR